MSEEETIFEILRDAPSSQLDESMSAKAEALIDKTPKEQAMGLFEIAHNCARYGLASDMLMMIFDVAVQTHCEEHSFDHKELYEESVELFKATLEE